MQHKTSRLKAMMITFLSISLAIILCIAFYYFKIQQNEKYQNQLHFRELNNITVSLNNGISAFSEFINQQNKNENSIEQSDLIVNFDKQKRIFVQSRQVIQEKREQQAKANVNAKTMIIPVNAFQSKTGALLSTAINKLKRDKEKSYSEVSTAMRALQNEMISFLSTQVNKVEVLASVDGGLIRENSEELRSFIAQNKNTKNCINRLSLADNKTGEFNKIVDVINATKTSNNEASAQKVYSQNSPLRNIANRSSSTVGLAKLQTGKQTTSWFVPIDDWLGGSNNLYPLVLLVDSKGTTVARKQLSELNSALVGIAFNDVTAFLDEDSNSNSRSQSNSLSKTLIHSTSKGVSKFLDIVISGNEYRLFMSPFPNESLQKMTSDCVDSSKGCKATFYIIGLREKDKFNSTNQTISRSIVAAAILFTLALVAFIPLLKIRLSSVTQAFSAWDRHTLAIGCVLLITVASVGLYDFRYYGKIKNEQDKLSKSLFMQMRNTFSHEVTTIIDLAFTNIHDSSIKNERLKVDTNKAKAQATINKRFKDYLLKNDTTTPYFLENLFILNARETLAESVKMDGLAMWATKSRYRGLNNNISLESREYALRGVRKQLWPVAIDKSILENKDDELIQNITKCDNGVFMERLFNLRDGGKSTQFSMSCEKNAQSGFYDSLSFGTQIQSFTNTVMPANFGFVVFDNITGKALYHSEDDSRSLVENVFVETDNSSLLKAYMNTPYFYNQPTSFAIDYNGKVHDFTLGALKDGVPWTLVVYYDKENSRALNLMSVLVTLTICFVVFVLTYYFVIMIVPKGSRRGIFWPTPAQSNKKKNITIISILAVAGLLFGGISLLIADYVFEHHQLKYQQINNAQLGQNIKVAGDSIKSYRNEVLDNESVVGKPIEGVLCFLGSKAVEDPSTSNNQLTKRSQTCSITPSQDALDVKLTNLVSYFDLLIESFWRFSVLDGNIDEKLVVTSQLSQTLAASQTSETLIDTSLNRYPFKRSQQSELMFNQSTSSTATMFLVNGLLSLVAAAVFLLLLFKIAKGWIFERFFGFNIPPFFRLNEKTRYNVNQALYDGFFDTNKHMIIVRPKLLTQQYLSSPSEFPDNPFAALFANAPLIEKSVVNLQTILAKGEPAELAIDHLIAGAKKSNPMAKKLTIAFSDLENTAFDETSRSFTLNAMEHLLTLPNINVILLCEVAPLYRLTQSELYPSKQGTNAPSSASDMVRWSNVLKDFIKVYDWCPNKKLRLSEDADAAATLIQEALAWPELLGVLKQFVIFNKSTHPENAEAYQKLLVNVESQKARVSEKLERTTLHINSNTVNDTGINDDWIPEQIIEFFGANAGALYRFKWEQCTKTERTILFQIASGLEPNPLNRGPLEHLVRRGYICRDRGWFLVNVSFKDFVLIAEPAETIERWLAHANESVWQYLRIPFFAIVIALIAIMAYTATDAVETAIGVLSAVFALIPLAIKNFATVKPGGN
ncbi:MAG: hypothetical protein ACJAW1_003168 [Glaciecola sp.]|jgi:hypothetical protein